MKKIPFSVFSQVGRAVPGEPSASAFIRAISAICGLLAAASASALSISNSTNTPTTNSAAIYADITNVITTTTATCYYGTTDGGTSAALWAYSTNYADATNGEISVTITNLQPATWYYYRWYVADTNSTAWSATSSNLTTTARAPTNYPAPGAGVTVVAGTNGVLLSPSNFFGANGIADSNTLNALQGAITTNTGNITTNAAIILATSQRVDNAEGAITTNAQNIGSISTRVDNAEGAIITNSGNIATNAQAIGALSNEVDNINSNLAAIPTPTNQIIVVDGTAYVITNAPASAGDVLVFDPVTTTACFAAQSGGSAAGTYPVFAIPLGGAWTDFEIKASTNNFASLVYYYKSWTTQDATRGDTNAAVYFTDDYADDVRVWRGKQKNEPISAHLLSEDSEVEYAYFYPSHDCEVAWSDWMFKTNASLVWSYVRVDDASFEMRADGAAQHWSPIRPHSWEKSMLEDVDIVALVPSPLPSTVTNDIFVSGSIYLGNDITAPSIKGLGVTNILHKAGTNEAIFGFPW